MTGAAPAFDPGSMADAAAKLAEYIAKLVAKISEFVDKINDLLGSWALRFLGAVKDAITWLAQKILDLVQWCLGKLKDAWTVVSAPLTFWNLGGDWGSEVQTPASDVAAVVQPNALRAPLDWSGEAADRYKLAVSLQGPAATSVSGMAGSVQLHLRIAAAGGLVFYVGLVAVAVKFFSVMTAATAAAATGVGAPIGLGGAAAEAAQDAAVIGGLIAAIAALVAGEASAVANIQNSANNHGAFPNNAWPVGTA